MPSSRGSSLMPASPPASLAGSGPQRQRRLRLVVAACAVVAAVVLLVAVEGWQQSAMQARHAEGAVVDQLGMPLDALVVDAGAGGKAGASSSWWALWQKRIADQEARVGAWRERQKQIVYEETAAEEAAAAASNKAALAAAAAEADALLGGAALGGAAGTAQQADDGPAVR